MTQEHRLIEVAEFGRPDERYFRWYCSCGAVGGKRSTDEAARRGHADHVEENR